MLGGIKVTLRSTKGDEVVFESAPRKDFIDVDEEFSLFAVFFWALNAGKCWTNLRHGGQKCLLCF